MTPLRIAVLAIATTLAAGCSSTASSSSALKTSPAHKSVASPGPSTSLTSTPATASPVTRVPMQTAAGGEFLSPSGNISCEVDYHRAGLTQVYCQTDTPPQSVTMNATGGYQPCTGEQCLGNPGTGTPTLAYGTATGAGPFLCTSVSTGVTCVAGGKGFQISTSGVTPVSA